MPTAAPTAIVDGSSRNGSTARLSASGSRIVSASSAMTPAMEAALMPAFEASALPPTVLLVDHHQIGLVERSIDSADGGRRDVLDVREWREDQTEGLLQEGEGPVGRPVIDHHDFPLRVVQGEQRAQALDDRQLLVVGGHDE